MSSIEYIFKNSFFQICELVDDWFFPANRYRKHIKTLFTGNFMSYHNDNAIFFLM